MPDRRLRILFVTSHYPHGEVYGTQQRVLYLCRALARMGTVSIALVDPETVDLEALKRTESEFEVKYFASASPDPLRGLAERARFELSASFMNTSFSAVSPGDREAMLELREQYDGVWVHTIRTANKLRISHWPRSVLDVDDLPSRLYQSEMAFNSFVRRAMDYRMSHIWRRRERRLNRRFSVISVCSENDRRYLGAGPEIRVVPNGFALSAQPRSRKPASPPRIGFIGLFRYLPNRVGMDWFVECVWPTIKKAVPDMRLRLIGRGSERDYSAAGPDIDVLGYIEDPTAEIDSWSAMIVPIKFGGGTRVKIAEGFARKCPVVSTRLGAFGYDIESGRHLFLADTADAFAAACVRLAQDGELARAIADNAWEEFQQNWTWDNIGGAAREALGASMETPAGRRELPSADVFLPTRK